MGPYLWRSSKSSMSCVWSLLEVQGTNRRADSTIGTTYVYIRCPSKYLGYIPHGRISSRNVSVCPIKLTRTTLQLKPRRLEANNKKNCFKVYTRMHYTTPLRFFRVNITYASSSWSSFLIYTRVACALLFFRLTCCSVNTIHFKMISNVDKSRSLKWSAAIQRTTRCTRSPLTGITCKARRRSAFFFHLITR